MTVPGDFILGAHQAPVQDHLHQHRKKVETLRPIPTCIYGADGIKSYIPQALTRAKYGFVHREAKETPFIPI